MTKRITGITGISNDMLENDGDLLEIVMGQFLDFIGDLRLVFYNAPFDMSFLVEAARKINRDIPNPVSDALDRVYSDGVDLTVAAPSGVVEFRRRWAVARSPAGVLV